MHVVFDRAGRRPFLCQGRKQGIIFGGQHAEQTGQLAIEFVIATGKGRGQKRDQGLSIGQREGGGRVASIASIHLRAAVRQPHVSQADLHQSHGFQAEGHFRTRVGS